MNYEVREHENEDNRDRGAKPDTENASIMIRNIDKSDRDSDHPIANEGEDSRQTLLTNASDHSINYLGKGFQEHIEIQHLITLGHYLIDLIRSAEEANYLLLEKDHN